MNRTAPAAALAFTLAVASSSACDRGEPGRVPDAGGPVDVVTVTPAPTSARMVVPGTVASARRAELATRMSGTIEAIGVEIGIRVAAGDTLLSLDTAEIDARIEQTRAAARLARKTFERIAALAEDGAATAQELDDAAARRASAQAALRDARAQRRYVVLTAPFDGTITARHADPGDLARPGAPLLVLLASGSVKIEADLPGQLGGALRTDDPVTVIHPETGQRHAARITRVVPALDSETRRFRVEAGFESEPPDLLPGAFVRLAFEVSAGGATRWIPADAVVRRGQLDAVYVVEDDRLRLRWVRLGRAEADAIELLAGPPAQARVVRSPDPSIEDGQPVGAVRVAEWAPPTGGTSITHVEDAP